MKRWFLLSLGLVFLASCVDEVSLPEEQAQEVKSSSDQVLSPEEAFENVLDVINSLSSSDNSRSITVSRKIQNAISLGTQFKDNSVFKSRIATSKIEFADTLAYIINFAREEGYALVTARPGGMGLCVFVENGNFSFENVDEERDDLFLQSISFLLNLEQYRVDGVTLPTNPPPPSTGNFVYFEGYRVIKHNLPKLATVWGQYSPYNNYFPVISGKKAPTGCVMVAVSQILSSYKRPTSVEWSDKYGSGYSIIDWPSILNACKEYKGRLNVMTSPEQSSQVAHLMRYISVALDAKIGSESTSADSDKAIKLFNDLGLVATSLKKYDEKAILDALDFNKMVYCRGNSEKHNFLFFTWYGGGHAWVIDGSLTGSKDGQISTLMHCNMGWDGTNNGYYTSQLFDTQAIAIPDNNITEDKLNYKYKLKYSVISK